MEKTAKALLESSIRIMQGYVGKLWGKLQE